MTVTVREAGEGQYWASVRIGPTDNGVDQLLRTPEDELFDDRDLAGTVAAQMGRQYIEATQAMSSTSDSPAADAHRQAQHKWVNAYVKAYREAAEGAADLRATAYDGYELWRSCSSQDPVAVARVERQRHLDEFAKLPRVPASDKRFEWD